MSGNLKIKDGRLAAIWKVTSLKINRLLPMATNYMHMKFQIKIPKQTWVTLRKPCRLQTDGQTDRQTDGQGDSSIPPHPPPTTTTTTTTTINNNNNNNFTTTTTTSLGGGTKKGLHNSETAAILNSPPPFLTLFNPTSYIISSNCDNTLAKVISRTIWMTYITLWYALHERVYIYPGYLWFHN